jgi:hypothetical protein
MWRSRLRVVRDLTAVVQIPALPVFHARQDLAFRGTIGTEFVGHNDSLHVARTLQQLAKEALSGLRVTPAPHQNIKHVAMLINGPPEIVQLAANADKHLIQEPLVARLRPASLEGFGITRPKRRLQSRIVS